MKKDMPNNWKVSKLEDVAQILDNLRVPVNSKERAERSGDVPYYGATGQVGWIDDFIFNEELILLGEDGAPFFDKSKNVAYLVDGKSWVNNHAHVLRAIDGITLNKYLLYFLNHFDYSGFVGGTTRLKLTQGSLKKIPFPLPPLPEQKRIVAKLDRLFAHLEVLKAKLDRIPELLAAFRQSVLTQAVTGKLTEEWRNQRNIDLSNWGESSIENLLSHDIKNGLYKPRSFYGSGVKIVRIDAFYDGFLKDFDSLQRVQLTEKEIEQYEISIDDILINRVNSIEYLGKCWHVTELPEKCVFESNMMNLSIDKVKITPSFLRTFLISRNGLTQLRSNAKHAVNQASINQTDVKNVLVPIPTLKEQHEIVHKVESLFAKADVIEVSYQILKAKIDHLPQAVLAKAFRGELVEQVPEDGDARDLLSKIKRQTQN